MTPYRLDITAAVLFFSEGVHRKTESDKFKAKFQDIAYLPSHEVGCLPPPTGSFELWPHPGPGKDKAGGRVG